MLAVLRPNDFLSSFNLNALIPILDADLDVHISEDYAIDQALKYLDRFDQSQGVSIHLHKGPTKRELNQKMDDQDGLKKVPKLIIDFLN